MCNRVPEGQGFLPIGTVVESALTAYIHSSYYASHNIKGGHLLVLNLEWMFGIFDCAFQKLPWHCNFDSRLGLIWVPDRNYRSINSIIDVSTGHVRTQTPVFVWLRSGLSRFATARISEDHLTYQLSAFPVCETTTSTETELIYAITSIERAFISIRWTNFPFFISFSISIIFSWERAQHSYCVHASTTMATLFCPSPCCCIRHHIRHMYCRSRFQYLISLSLARALPSFLPPPLSALPTLSSIGNRKIRFSHSHQLKLTFNCCWLLLLPLSPSLLHFHL